MRYLLIVLLVLGLAGAAWAENFFILDGQGGYVMGKVSSSGRILMLDSQGNISIGRISGGTEQRPESRESTEALARRIYEEAGETVGNRGWLPYEGPRGGKP